MPKEEWGVKRVCPTTGKRFYDMNRSPIVSPYTGETVTVDTGNKTRILAADKDDVDAKKDEKADDDLLLDDDDVDLDDDNAEGDETSDTVLDDDEDDDTVSLDEIADVGGDDDED
ncbi:TIGR02300 family protein [uncultured Jannaschia sp.]|uniref:TIGR02300 family protein n=1 Tax=uncultured Jannaschia sp. TaxID=293347 RepID=UPI00262D77BC|nr:TIGR02300 family protein [uncultured Jannaschia sp.]